jgi:hypothetical protein
VLFVSTVIFEVRHVQYAGCPKLQFGLKPMFKRAAFGTTFLLPNVVSVRRDFFARDWTGSGCIAKVS